MSRADFILDLVVRAAPYRDIFSGVKPEEYRADKEGKELWATRLVCDQTANGMDIQGLFLSELYHPRQTSTLANSFHPYHTARISLGYASDRPSHLRKIRGIRWGAPNPAWCYGIVTAEKCFIIELGEIIE